jgi:hypothetical protein
MLNGVKPRFVNVYLNERAMKFQLSNVGIALLALTMVMAAHAQDLTLFEGVQADATTSSGGALASARRTGASEPAYTLVGTSRIGAKRTATLMSSEGEIQRVEYKAGARVTVPGSAGITLVDFGSRSVSLRHPDGSPCVSSEDKGVRCEDGLSVLSMALAEPIRVQEPDPVDSTVAEGDTPSEDDVPANPFAAALRAAADNGGALEPNSRRERFQPRRIAPEDVPEGMRLVRTPFGDRLVER